MKWIDFRKQKPKYMCVALVFNEKGWMSGVKAIYHPKADTWVLYDPNYRESITVEVTHYLEIPAEPQRI